MGATSELLPPPNSPDDFESLCLDLWREIWGDKSAKKHGRSGQAQAGVDVYGLDAGRQVGVQCKQRSGHLHSKVSPKELEDEVVKARDFTPLLHTFILATSGPSDAPLQEKARALSLSERFKVEVCSWDDIWHEIYQRPELLARIRPIYWPQLTATGKQKTAPSRLSHTADKLFGRAADLARLALIWDERKVHLLTLVAFGGVGKTSLVGSWTGELAKRNYDGADYFDWSFYSQGTRDHSTASADVFIDNALRFFGDEAMADSARDGWSKGAQLAEILASRRALLVLDGLEPLQYPPGPMAGELKDPAMTALLRGLAARNAGLCVVTTREKLAELGRWPAAEEWELETLSADAGLALLESLGVHGAASEMNSLVKEVQGHALTISLIGRFLDRAYGGDVRKRDLIDLQKADLKTKGKGHAFRAMAAYEKWLAAGDEDNHRQLALLRLLGLFDRPASAACLQVLRKDPSIPGLTEPLVGLAEDDWQLLVKDLGDCGLVTYTTDSLDAHPLIREYFADQLRTQNPDAWRGSHGRIFDYLKNSAEEFPATLPGLQPLYQAVYHGCQAGQQQEACDEVYRDLILRGTGDNGYYSTKKLGAHGADLGAVACFFEQPWSRVSPSLSEAAQAWLLNEAAFRLRALGRLREGVEPMRAGLAWVEQHHNWLEAATFACNLSELELTLGEVKTAVADAERSLAFAESSGDAFMRVYSRSTEADARHQLGEEGAALALFREAECMQAEMQPQYPQLYSLPGFRYCDLLLAPAERAAWSGQDYRGPCGIEAFAEVERRATQTLEWAAQARAQLLDFALDHLSLGRSRLCRAILEGRASAAAVEAQDAIENAVAGLRASGYSYYQPLGLLTRAWLRFTCGDTKRTRADLDEAWEIAERGSMRLFLADVALYRARFFEDRAALAEARRLVTECGYGRRLAEIEDLETRS